MSEQFRKQWKAAMAENNAAKRRRRGKRKSPWVKPTLGVRVMPANKEEGTEK